MTPRSHEYLSQRLRLHYLEWGDRDAPPLVLLHGARDHCRNWDWLVPALSKDWRVIAPDLRGHGDSQWSLDGHYGMEAFVYDLARLIDELKLAPLRLIGHSLGGNICVRYTGVYPDKVLRLVSIEGLGASPALIAREAQIGVADRLQKWIAEQDDLATRTPRRYATLEEAAQRMQQGNPHLSTEQARHLTQHGIRQLEDGTYTWKFDPYVHSRPAVDITRPQINTLWSRIACPILLIYGKDSWASNPQEDGRSKLFNDARVASVANAGHWVHHDQLQTVTTLLKEFL